MSLMRKSAFPLFSKPMQQTRRGYSTGSGMTVEEEMKHEAASAKTWSRISLAGGIFAVTLAAYIFLTDVHPTSKKSYDYMQRRNKAYAWKDGDTSLFDSKNHH